MTDEKPKHIDCEHARQEIVCDCCPVCAAALKILRAWENENIQP